MPRHLIHVGYAKAGASFFKAWCESRDDVAFARRGFGGFHQVTEVPDAAVAPALRVTSSENLLALRGPASRRASIYRRIRGVPGGRRFGIVAVQERTCRVLHDLFPTAHILILIRGYDTVLRSAMSQATKRGLAAPARKLDKVLNEHWAHSLHYDRVVSLYEGAFGRGRVTVLPYELLRDDAAAFVAALCEAGAVPYRPFDPGRVNASPPPHALGLIQAMTPAVHRVIAPLPERAATRALAAYDHALRRVRSRSWFDRLGQALGVAPFETEPFSREALRAAFAGRADAVARRPEVVPYADHYTFGS